MAKKKVYAIKEGFDSSKNERVQNRIVDTWAECQKYIKGVKGAIYKSFEDEALAKSFLEEGSQLLRKGKDKYDEDCLHVYVDGSYYEATASYSYGVVAVKNEVVEYLQGGKAKSAKGSNIRQIAGELKAAISAVEYAINKKYDKLVIFHDYEGICHHATGFWSRKDDSSKEYYEKMQSFIKGGMKIEFVQVKSHEQDLFNEMADTICKSELGIDNDRVLEKYLIKNQIKVSSEKIKSQLEDLTKSGHNNIVVEAKEIEEATKDAEILESIDHQEAVLRKNNLIDDINLVLRELEEERLEEVLKYVKRKKKQKK